MVLTNAVMSQDTVKMIINNKVVATFISNQEPKNISIKKINVSPAKPFFIQFKAGTKDSPYKQSIEITDSKESQSTVLNITEQKNAQQNITALLKKYNFFKKQSIKIYLLLNPANDMMMMPSKRLYLGELTLK